ncbi:MAG: putative sugar O-methyltransferase [Proteobacteria bacterium]|nr:putative sugar O-methyltransferase [Pseudomonadota bacterium]
MDELNLMLSDMETANEFYRPTNFWQSGLSSIIRDIETHGYERFREHESAHFFYVPLHSKPTWRNRNRLVSLAIESLGILSKNTASRLRRMLDGRESAYAEYLLFLAADTNSGLRLNVGESGFGGGERFEFDRKLYSKSFLNYLRGLTFLKKLTDTDNISSIMEIGGGYGTLGEILLKSRSDGFYLNVDIPPVAAVATRYLKQVFGDDAVLGYEQSRNMRAIDLDTLRGSYRALVLCPWQLPSVKGSVDMFANFISFQEMEPAVVANYVSLVQPMVRHAVLLRNSVKGKTMAKQPGEVGVLEPTTTDDIIRAFDQFRVLGRDSAVFGYESRNGNFRSEVICMERNQANPPSQRTL